MMTMMTGRDADIDAIDKQSEGNDMKPIKLRMSSRILGIIKISMITSDVSYALGAYYPANADHSQCCNGL